MDSNIVSSDQSSPHHAVLFPFMSKGHTTPILHLARFLLRHDLTVTVFATPANRSFISESIGDTTVSVIELPLASNNVPDIPTGNQSTDKHPSASIFYDFAISTKLMQPDFERVLGTLSRVEIIVSDGFLWWTLESASKFGVPRFVFYGMNSYAVAVSREVAASGILQGVNSDDELVTVTRFPWIRVCKNEFDQGFNQDQNRPAYEFHMKVLSATRRSNGLIVNSFYELETAFIDYLNEYGSKAWCVGPLCLVEPPKFYSEPQTKPAWIRWLDQKVEQGSSVLYVAFGSQAFIWPEQFTEIAIGLEKCMVDFLWVIRKEEWELPDGFEERVKSRGIVVRDWVDQREILMHESVQGFLSHCGWNSVLESICAGVPILAWPMLAEQPLNAKMVEEEIKIGLRVETCNGSVKGFVKWEGLSKMVKELMDGEKGKEVRKNVKEVAVMAKKVVEEDGSSWQTLKSLIDETCRR